MTKVINLTQHTFSAEQVQDLINMGLEIVDGVYPSNFEEMPTVATLEERAAEQAAQAAELGCTAAMIGGAPYYMAPLERALKARGIQPLYAFSQRESVEQTQPDGSVRKVAVFRHLGFYKA